MDQLFEKPGLEVALLELQTRFENRRCSNCRFCVLLEDSYNLLCGADAVGRRSPDYSALGVCIRNAPSSQGGFPLVRAVYCVCGEHVGVEEK